MRDVPWGARRGLGGAFHPPGRVCLLLAAFVLTLQCLPVCVAAPDSAEESPKRASADDGFDPNAFKPADLYLKRSFEENGRWIDEVVVPGRPPATYRAPAAPVPRARPLEGVNVLTDVPAFDWSYGCSATAAAMMMGYYDNGPYTAMYSGPANGGVCPMTNAVWGAGECPLSATHMGYDALAARGHVDDYWIEYGDPGPDPYIVNGWPEHTHADCTGDFMGTNQSAKQNSDGSTTFFFYTDGSPLYDYTGCEPDQRDGCHGLRLFVESRGYAVTTNFSQYIYGYRGNKQGFTYEQFQQEIDAGRPVMIHVTGHSMVGFGYDTSTDIVYIHDTWDHLDHQMTWGQPYSGLQHYAVTVLRVEEVATLGVSVTPATFGFGFVDPGATADSAGQPLVVTNTGNVAEDIGIRIKDEDDRDEWTAGTPAQNVYRLSTRLAETMGVFGAQDVLATALQWCDGAKFGGGGCNMAAGSTVNQWFQFEAPTSVTGEHARGQHSITVEVSCRQH